MAKLTTFLTVVPTIDDSVLGTDNTNPSITRTFTLDGIYGVFYSLMVPSIVSQTILSGVTTKAPSEDAVYNALLLKQKTITLTTTGTSGAATFNSTTGALNIPQYAGGGGGSGTVTSIVSGSGMNFTTITSTGTITLGTPSSTTLSSTNALTTTSHTHAFTPGGTTSQYITGAGTLVTFPTMDRSLQQVLDYDHSLVNGKNAQGTGAGSFVSATQYNFFGTSAGYFSDAANNSNFFGENAGFYAPNANHSNFIGSGAGYTADNASNSNFFGDTAGYDAKNAQHSNFFGYRSGYLATGASYSNLLGYNTGNNQYTSSLGSNNIIIGTNISLPSATSNSINIGGILFGTGTYSNTSTSSASIIPTSGARIGIGVVTPSTKLHIYSDTANTSGLRLERLTSSSPTSTGQTIGVDSTGNIVTVASGGGGGGGISNAIATGTDTYTATVSGVTSYVDGAAYLIRFTNGNTTISTLNINGLGAIPLYRNNDGQLIGGDIEDGGEILCVYNSTLNNFQCIGTSPNSIIAYVTNADSVTITKGQPVYAYKGIGDRMTVKLAYNTSDATSAQTVGLVMSTSIAAGQKGFIMMQGLLDGLSTLSSPFLDGDAVYLASTAGNITRVKQYAPNHLVYLGFVTTASPGAAGRMYVRVQNGYELDELHNVQAQSPTNKDTLYYDSTVSPTQWKTGSVSSILGYTPANDSLVVHKLGTETISGTKTFVGQLYAATNNVNSAIISTSSNDVDTIVHPIALSVIADTVDGAGYATALDVSATGDGYTKAMTISQGSDNDALTIYANSGNAGIRISNAASGIITSSCDFGAQLIGTDTGLYTTGSFYGINSIATSGPGIRSQGSTIGIELTTTLSTGGKGITYTTTNGICAEFTTSATATGVKFNAPNTSTGNVLVINNGTTDILSISAIGKITTLNTIFSNMSGATVSAAITATASTSFSIDEDNAGLRATGYYGVKASGNAYGVYSFGTTVGVYGTGSTGGFFETGTNGTAVRITHSGVNKTGLLINTTTASTGFPFKIIKDSTTSASINNNGTLAINASGTSSAGTFYGGNEVITAISNNIGSGVSFSTTIESGQTALFVSGVGTGSNGFNIDYDTGSTGYSLYSRLYNGTSFDVKASIDQLGVAEFTTIKKIGGSPTQYLMADGSTTSSTTPLTLSVIGSTPNANAATLTGTALNLQPASASFGGVVTTTTQTLAGEKTFNNIIRFSNAMGIGSDYFNSIKLFGFSSNSIEFDMGSSSNAVINTSLNTFVFNKPIQSELNATSLTVNSTTAGFLPPRMTKTQREAIASPSTGSVLYDTTANLPLTYNGTSWSGMGNYGTIIVTSSTSFTTPANITPSTVFIIELVGAGGGGGGGATGTSAGGSGAGGGGYVYKKITGLTPSTTYTCSIGVGGTGGALSSNGTSGTSTTLTIGATTYTASGGGFGIGVISSAGGAGGTGTNGDINISGQTGGDSLAAAASVPSSAGGSSPKGWGLGGLGVLTPSNGDNATGYGGGGSAGKGTTGSPTGGNGTNGIIYCQYYN